MSKELNWLLGQAIWGLRTAIVNRESARVERVQERRADGEEIVLIDGMRWRIWYDAQGNRNATPLAEAGQ